MAVLGALRHVASAILLVRLRLRRKMQDLKIQEKKTRPNDNMVCVARTLVLGWLLAAAPLIAGADFPGPRIGAAAATQDGAGCTLGNDVIRVGFTLKDGRLRLRNIRDLLNGKTLDCGDGNLFSIRQADGRVVTSADCTVSAGPKVESLLPEAKSARLAGRLPGRCLTATFSDADGKLRIQWRALLTDGANYLRMELDVGTSAADCVIEEVAWLDLSVAGARVAGRTDGSPVVAGNFFFGCEDPTAVSLAAAAATEGAPAAVSCRLRRHAVLGGGGSLAVSYVMGVAPAGQLRRAFLSYLERERAHPYRPYLHYNSWHDLHGSALNETNCLDVIRSFGERFIKPYGVVMDGLVFDDGWDDPKTLWQFNAGFPHEFTPLAEACRKYQAGLGVWLSPFGGYDVAKEQRLKFGREQGYETNASGFSLAGPKYYAAFKQACVNMIRVHGVNHFKFDGIAAGMYANGGAQFALDTEAMRRLMLELRREDPDLYINLTTGSWPSPFWLRYADSIWRQGGDMGQAGTGSKQQQWLTYRDQEVYRNIVGKGPLFPLNSLMTQGVAYSRNGMAGDPTFTPAGFKDDVRAFFGSGTGLQELYLQPGKLTAEDWAVLAEAAKWSRANTDVLVDTHWIGGDPSKLEIYGYASWSPRKGIVMLRNPNEQTQSFTLDVGSAFELPAAAARTFTLRSPWAEDSAQPGVSAAAGQPLTLLLKPFEILILEATP